MDRSMALGVMFESTSKISSRIFKTLPSIVTLKIYQNELTREMFLEAFLSIFRDGVGMFVFTELKIRFPFRESHTHVV